MKLVISASPHIDSGATTFSFLAAAYRIRPSPPIKAVISSM